MTGPFVGPAEVFRNRSRVAEAILTATVVTLIWLLPYAALVPDAVGALAEVGLMCGGLGLCVLRRKLLDPVVIIVLAVIAYWVVLSVLPNVPSLYVAGLGVRKTTLALTGVVVGMGLPRPMRGRIVLHVVASLSVALGVSISIHMLAPAFEAGIERTAAVDTGLYNNEARLQGVFPGPFHTALAAVLILVCLPWVFRRSRAAAGIVLLVGTSALYLTSVRSAIIAVAVGILAVAMSGGTLRQRLRRGAVVAVVGTLLCGLALVAGGERFRAALASLMTPWDDSRLLNRLEFYEEGWSLVGQSPVFGWGPGSAGDTMGSYFASGAHVNSHNFALKVLVEGGVVGLLLWLAVLGFLAVRLWRAQDTELRSAGVGVLVAFLVYGLTGSAVEALPVSTFVFLIVTVATVSSNVRDGEERSDAPDHHGRAPHPAEST